ncbi:uncharacterized protein EAF01_007214 [Botrytis porri]|uniref:uncharacterized protein n=1 Tax=Botrytis porri TaxID=87229 RepID=UPI001902BDC8|nr:uncharacterized protein EAF01_007214 [Botrytis porri]KAF7901916.1 hypothetical protein EAF01_007214 [Botrytis porri]
MESYQRKWAFPAVRILYEVPEMSPAGDHCNDGTITWETCSQLNAETPMRVGPEHAQHTGYCITRIVSRCRSWRPQQWDPFVCCYHILTRVETQLRKGYCLGENCPGLEGAKSIPVVEYDPAAYYSGDRLQYEREKLDLLKAEEETGKDVRFQWKNADGPGYETFEEENSRYMFGFQGRNRVPKPVMSYIPNDSWWRPH